MSESDLDAIVRLAYEILSYKMTNDDQTQHQI